MALYEVAALGNPKPEQLHDLEQGLRAAATAYQLEFGTDLTLLIDPARFGPPQRTTAVALT